MPACLGAFPCGCWLPVRMRTIGKETLVLWEQQRDLELTEEGMSEPIHQEVAFKATPKRIYEVLLDSKSFSEFTGGAPAEISRDAGGAFSCFGGIISGRNIELLPNRRIVQAWRVGNWPDGVYSIVKFELHQQGSETKLVMDHVGFPPELRAHLNGDQPDGGWHRQYWDPLKRYLA
jgi:activator of HSP90 ATPase